MSSICLMAVSEGLMSSIAFQYIRVLVKGLAATKFDVAVIDDTVWVASPSVLVSR
jgi:hypothetical protein